MKQETIHHSKLPVEDKSLGNVQITLMETRAYHLYKSHTSMKQLTSWTAKRENRWQYCFKWKILEYRS